MNLVDLVIIFILIYFAFQGFTRGLIASVLNLITTIVSIFLAVVYYPSVGEFLAKNWQISQNISPLAAFFGILIISEILLGFLASRVYLLIRSFLKVIPPLFYVDKVLGLVPSVAMGAFLTTVFLIIPLILPIQTGIKGSIQESWWGKNVLPKALVFEPEIQKFIRRLPSKNLLYVITPNPESKDTIRFDFPLEKKLAVDEASEKKMLGLVNKERESRGLKALVIDPTIVPVARAHSKDMFERQYFSHYTPEGKSPFERMTKGGVDYLAAGENLAYAPTVEIAHQGLMNSPGHKANILREEFGRVGIGVIDGGIYGKMFTQNFAD